MFYHNKKRNVGLLNDFFAKYIANAVIEQNTAGIEKANAIYKKYFSDKTEIFKEWNLFKTLYETKLTSREIAQSLIEKVRIAAGTLNSAILEAEKTKLIHEINNTLADQNFFKREVHDYKLQATIQILLNNWREKKLIESLGESAFLENVVLEHLVRTQSSIDEHTKYLQMDNEEISKEISSLVVKIMTEKFNSKFGEELFDEQREIISNYVFAKSKEHSKATLENLLDSIKNRTLNLIEKTLSVKKIENEEISESLSKKLIGIKNLLLNEYKDVKKMNDDTIIFYMTLVKLEKELA